MLALCLPRFSILDFDFVLLCGSSYDQPAPQLEALFAQLLAHHAEGTFALGEEAEPEPHAAPRDPLSVPYPFPSRDLRDGGQVVTQFLSPHGSFLWRAGAPHLIYIEAFFPESYEDVVADFEPLLFAIALGDLDAQDWIEGTCLERGARKVLLLGEDGTAIRQVWLEAIVGGRARLVSNAAVWVDRAARALRPILRSPRLAGEHPWEHIGASIPLRPTQVLRGVQSLALDAVILSSSSGAARALGAADLERALLGHCHGDGARVLAPAMLQNAHGVEVGSADQLRIALDRFLEPGSVRA